MKMVAYGVFMHEEILSTRLVVSIGLSRRLTRVAAKAHITAAINYSVIRAFRALRPLRALKSVPGMPLLVQSILGVLPKLADVAMLCGFVLIIFGIVGIRLFKSTLHYGCVPAEAEQRMMRNGKPHLRGAADIDQHPTLEDLDVTCRPFLSDIHQVRGQ